jgi:hypothetical protein
MPKNPNIEVEPDSTDAKLVTHPCACQCGGQTRSVAATFLQGHDAKLVSKLVADLFEGTGTGLGILPKSQFKADTQERINRITAAVSQKYSPALATKFDRAAQNRWANLETKKLRANAKANKTKNQPGPRQPVDPFQGTTDEAPAEQKVELATGSEHGLGAKVRIKVGRYEYDGEVTGMSQAGKVTAVAYKNKAGNTKVINGPAIQLI